MQYKRLIISGIFLILLLALTTAIYFLQQPQVTQNQTTLDNKIHTSFYQNAVGFWDAAMSTGPFQEGSSTAIRLSWSPPEQVYNHFLITVTDTKSGWTSTESGEHDRLSLDITNLQPDTNYTFVLQACLDPKCSSWITSDQEVEDQTPQMVWQISPVTEDLSQLKEPEDWQTQVILDQIILQQEDGTVFSSEEKSALVLNRVTLLEKTGQQIMTLTNAKGDALHAKLLNP